MQRSTTQAYSFNNATGWFLGILALALTLRMWGITFGLPYDFTPDEVHEIVRAMKLGAGEYVWHGGKGGLYLLLFVEYGFLFVFWWLTGKVDGPADFAAAYLTDPTAFYLLGRSTVAVMGALTCLVVYLLARRLYDKRTALLAALFGATAYYHAFWSHYINVDIGMVLAIWASILLYLVFEQTQRMRWLLGAGAFAAMAMAFKTPGVVVGPVLAIALVTSVGIPGRGDLRTLGRNALVLGISTLLALSFISPERVLEIGSLLPKYFGDLAAAGAGDASNSPESQDVDAAIYELTVGHGPTYVQILTKNWNIVLSIAALAGICLAVWRRHRWDLIWATFVMVFLVGMTLADRPGTERYILPIVPALWLLAARAVTALPGRPLVTTAAVVLILGYPLFAIIQQNYLWTRPDTRVIAKQWIETNVPADARILMDGMKYRFIHSPPLNPNAVAVSRRVERAQAQEGQISRGISSNTLSLYAEAMANVSGPKYDLHSTVWGLEVRDLSYYAAACFDYVVISSEIAGRYESPAQAERHPESARFYQALRNDPRLSRVFSAEPVPWQIQGPRIDVYRLDSDCDGQSSMD